MWLSGFYLLANVVCLAVLLHRKYASIWPLFLAFQAVVCVQAGVRLVMITGGFTDRASWMQKWAPGEMLLLFFAAAVVGESLWKSLREVPKSRPPIFFGLCVGIPLATSCVVGISSRGDWYDRFLVYRADVFLALALLTFVGFWGCLHYAQRLPRVARMHAGLLAALFAGHVLMVDWSQWGRSNFNYRLWEMLCCAGWVLNCYFLRQEFALTDRRFADAVLARISGHLPLPAAFPHAHVRALQADPLRSGR